MAAQDQSVANLDRFLGHLIQATGALQKIGAHIEESAGTLTQLEDQVSDDGGGLNDELEAMESAVERGEHDAREAMDELTQAGTGGETELDQERDHLARTTSELEAAGTGAEDDLHEAHRSLVAEGFEPILQMLGDLEQQLDGAKEAALQTSTEVQKAVEGMHEDRAAWDAVESELDEVRSTFAQAESSLATEASAAEQAFDELAGHAEAACSTLASQVDIMYDALDAAVAAQGQEWVDALEAASDQAVASIARAHADRLSPTAIRVSTEALPSLAAEYDALQTTIDLTIPTAAFVQGMADDVDISLRVIPKVQQLLESLGG